MFAINELQRQGAPHTFGFDTWQAMWRNYTVFALVRNPFDRAASAYDYIQSEREVCTLSMGLVSNTLHNVVYKTNFRQQHLGIAPCAWALHVVCPVQCLTLNYLTKVHNTLRIGMQSSKSLCRLFAAQTSVSDCVAWTCVTVGTFVQPC